MKKNSTKKQDDYELHEEYDLTKMTILPKGRFDPKRRIGSNVVVLEPDVAKAFKSDEAVNEALRLILKASQLAQNTSKP
jgi:16S rRNA A1518/A1519 N6-dimethyltransferase RsmA/KsgA/DIM1 with predicted DNA glycosylase/AP lyase activity